MDALDKAWEWATGQDDKAWRRFEELKRAGSPMTEEEEWHYFQDHIWKNLPYVPLEVKEQVGFDISMLFDTCIKEMESWTEPHNRKGSLWFKMLTLVPIRNALNAQIAIVDKLLAEAAAEEEHGCEESEPTLDPIREFFEADASKYTRLKTKPYEHPMLKKKEE